jgi:UDP-glucose:(heptosyl)LPS alpha-1,3-glucosyltransferase
LQGSEIYVKKIALSIEKFSRSAGGAELYSVSIASALVNERWEVHLFGRSWEGEPGEANFHEIAVPNYLPSWMKMLVFALKHRSILRNQSFDVILGFGNTLLMNVYQSHGGVHWYSTMRKTYSERNPFRRWIKRLIIKLSLKQWVRHWIESAPFRQEKRPVIIAISHMVKEDMVSYYGLAEEDIRIVYNGVNHEKYNPQIRQTLRGPIREELGVNEEDVVFLFVSYDLKKKGIMPLVDAVARLKQSNNANFKLLVVGGHPSQSLRRYIGKRNVRDMIVFKGATRSIEQVYADSDVMVLPTYYDACSLVVIEAMACGLPPITTVYNGVAGIITDGHNGYVINHPPHPEELSEKMRVLLSRERRVRMSEEAIRTSKSLTMEENHRQIIELCNRVAESNPIER